MEKSRQTKSQTNGTSSRDRYWSVMLVGEHGRVIPFPHFKGVVIGAVCIIVLSLAAAVTLGVLYARQGDQIGQMQQLVKDLQDQNAELRDEKDVLLAKMVVKQQTATHTDATGVRSRVDELTPSTKVKEIPAASAPDPEPQKPQAPKKSTPPPPQSVTWRADIRQFQVSYDDQREILRARFRIYNKSTPKKALAGRSVVVFKVHNDPPVKWLALPSVTLFKGVPDGKRGQAFKINNYRTLTFKAYKLKRPIAYDTATAYVFDANGKLLISRDLEFKIAPKPAPKPKPQTPENQPSDSGKQPVPSPPPSKSGASDKTPSDTAPAAPPVRQQTITAPDQLPTTDKEGGETPPSPQVPQVQPTPKSQTAKEKAESQAQPELDSQVENPQPQEPADTAQPKP